MGAIPPGCSDVQRSVALGINQIRVSSVVEEEGDNAFYASDSPEVMAIDRQALAQVVGALDELPKRTRLAFELYRSGSHTQREIAQLLDVSPTSVNFMIRDALTHCRQSVRS